jgi:hypothetical protein
VLRHYYSCKEYNTYPTPSYKYLVIDIHHKLNWNYSVEKRINGGREAYYGLKNNCKSSDLWIWDEKISSFTLSSLQLSYMDVMFGVAVYLEDLGER